MADQRKVLLSQGLGIANLANNIASSAKTLGNAFGLFRPDPIFPAYPDLAITSDFQKEYWYKTPSQGLYAFSVEKDGQGTTSEFPAFVNNIASLFGGIDTALGGIGDPTFGEFNLPITPQEITQTEDFAVSVKPTQGGTVVNYSGNKYKTLSISGTTGVQPFKGINGAFQGTGNVIGKEDILQYRSGYEVFKHFRAWMRSYHEFKTETASSGFRMLFRNYKDWEFLYVEPLKFTMNRDATKPLLYHYTIQFKVLGVLNVKRPIFDVIVAKLNDIGDAVNNSILLLKKNDSASKELTGDLGYIKDALNNINLALTSARNGAADLGALGSDLVKGLSPRETAQTLGLIANQLVIAGGSTATAEKNNTVPNGKDPIKAGEALLNMVKNPTLPSEASLKAQLNNLLQNEGAVVTAVKVSNLPVNVRQALYAQQLNAALISRVTVKKTQDQVQAVYDKLVQGVNLGDTLYDSIFGLTPTVSVGNTVQVNDSQYEMMYAFSESVRSIDGVLSSDQMFDKNAAVFKKSNSANGADSVGVGVFSLPGTSTPTKEGFVPAGMTLEDIALQELGSTSRWTEIAELNNLKAPYLITASQTLGPNYTIESENYSDPVQIKFLDISSYYLIPNLPIPSGAWAGKGNYVARYNGGAYSDPASWVFIYPDDGTLVLSNGTGNYLKFQVVGGIWVIADPVDFLLDGVLKPGDKIKIPAGTTSPLKTPMQGPRDNPFTNLLTNAEKSLSVDLRLNDQKDLDLLPSGDLNVATGYDNASQAIVLKLLYEKGSLKKYPSIGTNLTVGAKMPDIANIRSDLLTSLLQDTRIKNVTKINIIQENSSLFLTFEVIFNDLQQPVPITLPI